MTWPFSFSDKEKGTALCKARRRRRLVAVPGPSGRQVWWRPTRHALLQRLSLAHPARPSHPGRRSTRATDEIDRAYGRQSAAAPGWGSSGTDGRRCPLESVRDRTGELTVDVTWRGRQIAKQRRRRAGTVGVWDGLYNAVVYRYEARIQRILRTNQDSKITNLSIFI